MIVSNTPPTKDHLLRNYWELNPSENYVRRPTRIELSTISFNIGEINAWIRFYDIIYQKNKPGLPHFDFILKKGEKEISRNQIAITSIEDLYLKGDHLKNLHHFFSREMEVLNFDITIELFMNLYVRIIGSNDKIQDCFFYFSGELRLSNFNWYNLDVKPLKVEEGLLYTPFYPMIFNQAANAVSLFNNHIYSDYHNY